ncbi:MAG: ATP-binding cassette domain-containing protein [Anaerolineae bacterium]|nr:ATP-binding cassette domain-containing protein [Anaerolineae bacterium]
MSLQLVNVSCWHGKMCVVSEVSFHIAAGEHVALVGGNGSGKSTLMRSILGLHRAYHGQILLHGKADVPRADLHDRFRSIAYMPQRQTTGHFPLLVRELLASSRQLAASQLAAERLNVWQLAARPLHTLSGGQLQRVFLARAIGMLAGEAKLLLADEPTAALDFGGQAEIAQVLADLPVATLVITHDRAVMSRCDRVFEMAGGCLREV